MPDALSEPIFGAGRYRAISPAFSVSIRVSGSNTKRFVSKDFPPSQYIPIAFVGVPFISVSLNVYFISHSGECSGDHSGSSSAKDSG